MSEDDGEIEYTPAELDALSTKELLKMAAKYVDIGSQWNFDRAQIENEDGVGVGEDKWVNGRDLREALEKRAEAGRTVTL